MMNRLSPKLRNRIGAAFIVAVLLSGLLALDLANRGLAWQFAWSVTGEETPMAQARGMIEWIMSHTRPQPRTQPMTPIQHTGYNPYGINTFLQLEVESEKVEAQLQMIRDAGFTWIRQQFPWEDLEVDGRGQFTDSRNDLDGDGEPDTIDAWIKYDRIVDLAEHYDIAIQARLDNPPSWAHADPSIGAFAPPDDLQDFVNYAVAVAERYEGRIRFYQIWNEPNIFPEWGNQSVNPEAYTELLCRTYDAMKAVNPDIVIISGALAPTLALTGRDLNDFIFLQRMYQAGAGECFDILSVQGYGLNSGPTDRRMRPTTVNVARNQYIRDLMIANGDSHKAIWISEAAWNYVPTYEELPLNPDGSDPIAGRLNFGQVTPQQAADYIPQLYQRAQEEWPWVGVVNYWFFTRPDPSESNQPQYYFRMVEPDYDPQRTPPFTPLPVYESLREYITTQTPTLYQGVHQIENHWAIDVGDRAEVTESENAQFGQAMHLDTVAFTVNGTGVMIRWQGEALRVMGADGDVETFTSVTDEWHQTIVQSSTLPQTVTLTMAGDDLTIDSVTVLNRTYANVFPYMSAFLVVLSLLVFALVDILRSRRLD